MTAPLSEIRKVEWPYGALEDIAINPEQWRGDGDPDVWPYPAQFTRTAATGDLAAAIRSKLGLPDHERVVLVERIESTGWSEFTQEEDRYLDVEAGGVTHSIADGSSWLSTVEALLQWLDDPAT